MTTGAGRLRTEAMERIREIGRHPLPSLAWPRGCYGAARAWLLFVGPSPGGLEGSAPPSRPWDEEPLHNVVFDDFRDWNGGFPVSMEPLVTGLIGLPFRLSGRLYAIANLDWKKTPRASEVSTDHMKAGLPDMFEVLKMTQARVLVPMTRQVARLLIDYLREEKGAQIDYVTNQVRIPIGTAGTKCHRQIDTWLVTGPSRSGIQGVRIVRLPQHPARIFTKPYAARISREVRRVIAALDRP